MGAKRVSNGSSRRSSKRVAKNPVSSDSEEEGGFFRSTPPTQGSKRASKSRVGKQESEDQSAATSSPGETSQGSSHVSASSRSSTDSDPKPKSRRAARRTNRRVTIVDDDDEEEDNDDDDDYQGSESSDDDDYQDEPSDDDIVEEVVVEEGDDDIIVVSAAPSTPAPRRRTVQRRVLTEEEQQAAEKKRFYSNVSSTNKNLYANHPHLEHVFEDLANREPIKPEAIPQPEGLALELLPFQREGLNWLIKQEEGPYKGGILADEMGMGKTIQTVALFLSDEARSKRKPGQPNLVIAPTVAIVQWQNEIAQHTQGKLSTVLFHGGNRTNKTEELSKFDVVLTSYAVVESEYRRQQYGFQKAGKLRKQPSALFGLHYTRIVLDEAHNIKDRQSNTSRACFNLSGDYRLCLSGTPLQNRIGEMYSLLRFLKVEPFCQYFCKKCECSSHQWQFSNGRTCDQCGHAGMSHCNFFNHSLLKHIQKSHLGIEIDESMVNLRLLVQHIMLRRTKIERADDLGLPPRIATVRRDYFNEEEKDLYASIYSDSTRKFNTYVNSGVVLNNYANIFTLITRMRQIADHPDLVLRRQQATIQASGAGYNSLVCQICDDEAEDAIQSKCRHTFCRMCISEYCQGFTGNEKDLECPVCHIGLSIDLNAPAISLSDDTEDIEEEPSKKKGSIVNRINMLGGWRSSTKIEALVEELFRLRSDRQTIKSIVFSQFTSMLDLVEWRLRRAGFQTVKLQGNMSPTQRNSIIQHFMSTPSVEIFLVSLKAGGVALNLCEASQVFILDPWWNPSVEWQSGDRVHRIGQHRPVKITRLVIEDSIEARIIELQEKKARMIQATIGKDDSAMNRLTPEDMQFLFQN